MANYFQEAGDAIGSVVQTIKPTNNWGNLIPTSLPPGGWGMSLPNWMAAGRRMVAAMNAAIAPKRISLKKSEIAKSGNEELYKLQRVLADKARLA
ncbi:MAG TPA: hypothetical protein VFR28_01320 [Allosphingosinicella sp.]|nr:hypothetical protein [Allosphingosinicella sp.]